MPTLLICPNCGGPLPPVAGQVPYVTCAYCAATSNVESGTVTPREEHAHAAQDPRAEAHAAETRRQALVAFQQALESLSASSPVAYDDFREACRVHLQALGQTDSIARVAYNLALDAEHDLDESLRTRGGALARLTVGYMEAVGHLRDKPRHELNLPFLFATPQGPRHYSRILDVATIQALAERDPAVASARRSGGAKGFWAKLFG